MMFKIHSLGAQGDGLAETPSQTRHIPFSLPGERVSLRRDPPQTKQDVVIHDPSPDRVVPPCPHFGDCGGCRLQHLSPDRYKEFKKDKIRQALDRAGLFNVDLLTPLIFEKGRRRATLHFSVKRGGGCQLGFYQRDSHRLCDLKHCLILVPELTSLLAPLRAFLETLPIPKKGLSGQLHLLKSDTGVDVALMTSSPITQDLSFHEGVQALVQQHSLARFSLNGEVVICPEAPCVWINQVRVSVSARHFLQANQEAEEKMMSFVVQEVQKAFPDFAPKLVDLFCGRGLFTFALKDVAASTVGYEMDFEACQAFEQAARPFAHLKGERRNLFTNPLTAADLETIDGVILDPPRDGALAQSRLLAASKVPFICYVSCKPETFARDAKYLVEGGYTLTGVQPIDQFYWSHHSELIAVFKR